MHDLNSFKEKRGMIYKTLFYVHTKQNIIVKVTCIYIIVLILYFYALQNFRKIP